MGRSVELPESDVGASGHSLRPVRKLYFHQASPLARDYAPYEPSPITDRIDIDTAENSVRETLKDSCFEPVFRPATSKSIGDFLSEGGRFLHLTAHGTPSSLLIEDDIGGAQTLKTDETLRDWISLGGGKLSLVFLAACHSRKAGDYFVQAGARHVICCRDNRQKLSHTATIVFVERFYKSLSNGSTTVKTAFDLAVEELPRDPRLRREAEKWRFDAKQEAKKFVLLPEGENHDVLPFNDDDGIQVDYGIESYSVDCMGMLPAQPRHFCGRDLEMYRIIKALIVYEARLVRISGGPGMGKNALAQAVSVFMAKRKSWGDAIWLPPVPGSKSIALMDDFENVIQAICSSDRKPSELQTDNRYRDLQKQLMSDLKDRKAVLFLNLTKYGPDIVARMGAWLDEIFTGSRLIKVVVVDNKCKVQSCFKAGFNCIEHQEDLKPLSPDSAQLVFTLLSQQEHSEIVLKNVFYISSLSPGKIAYIAKNMNAKKFEGLDQLLNESRLNDLKTDVDETFGGSSDSTKKTDDGPSTRFQHEVQGHFAKKLAQSNMYRKCVGTYLRKAIEGEDVVIREAGSVEVHVITDPTSWIARSKDVAGDQYILKVTDFEESYIPNSACSIADVAPHLHKLGFREYSSKRQVFASQVTKQDMEWFHKSNGREVKKAAFFEAPWGKARVEEGDYLVKLSSGNNDEVYPVNQYIFVNTYRAIHDVIETETPRSQQEVQEHFLPKLKEAGNVYRKSQSAYLRPAVMGEEIMTVVNGKRESLGKVNDGHSWVACGKLAGEMYVLTSSDFAASYDESSASSLESLNPYLHKQGFREYGPKRKVWGHEVTSEDMKWFRRNRQAISGEQVHFMAPWHEKMLVEEGDFLVVLYPSGNDEIYRVEKIIFAATYNLTGAPRSQEEVQRRFVNLLQEGNHVYRKSQTAYLRRGVKGEQIDTVVDGKHESKAQVLDDTSWVACGIAGERYVLTAKAFSDSYDETSATSIEVNNPYLHQQGFCEYRSKRKIFSHVVTEEDMEWFRNGKEVGPGEGTRFMAPWGEEMLVEKGDSLAMLYPRGNPEIYRVEKTVFHSTYEELHKCRSHEEIQRRFFTSYKECECLYRRRDTSFLRKGNMGDIITTVIDGKFISKAQVSEEAPWVACGKSPGERYVVTTKEFEELYDGSSSSSVESSQPYLHKLGFREYRSKKKVIAYVITDDDLAWLAAGREVAKGEAHSFFSPGGEEIFVRVGDYLVINQKEGESRLISCLKKPEFEARYEKVEM